MFQNQKLTRLAYAIFILILSNVCFADLHEKQSAQLKKYFSDTYRSLDCMRHTSGLIADHLVVEASDITLNDSNTKCPQLVLDQNATSPTNIGFDLLAQLEALAHLHLQDEALVKIHRTLEILGQFERESVSGLYFARYNLVEPYRVDQYFISAIDNMHLYLALKVIDGAHHNQRLTRLLNNERMSLFKRNGQQAAHLLEKYEMAKFFDPSTGLAHGGLELVDHQWQRTAWAFRHFGSEGRILYSLGYAFEFFQTPVQKPLSEMIFETVLDRSSEHALLSLWDGGAFQLLLPRQLIREDLYSNTMKKFYNNYAEYALDEGVRRQLSTPASHSACHYSALDRSYLGSAGNLELVSRLNRDVNDPIKRARWQSIFTPHAAFLAAPLSKQIYLQKFFELESVTDGQRQLYVNGLGWLDGFHVEGERKGEIVHILLSLDQAMILFSVAEMLSESQLTLSAEYLRRDSTHQKRLHEYFETLSTIPIFK